ncbi:hypothetical protein HN51_060173 [Arachis hypogaea]
MLQSQSNACVLVRASRRPVIAHALPCPAFAALSRTVGLSMPCLTSSKCSNLEKNDTLSIENILAKALLDSPNKKEKRITTVNPLASSTWEKVHFDQLRPTRVVTTDYLHHGQLLPCLFWEFNEFMTLYKISSDDHGKIKLNQLPDNTQKLWNSSLEPVKKFLWNRALDNFIQLILDLFVDIVKYLVVPMFIVTSISELSYSPYEWKLTLVPIPFLFANY